MKKLYKAIKLHRNVRIRQEIACFKIVMNSQNYCQATDEMLLELQQMNLATTRLNKIIHPFYHHVLNLFGYGYRMRKEIKRKTKNIWLK